MRKRIVSIFIVVCMLLGSLLIFGASARPQPRPVRINVMFDHGASSRARNNRGSEPAPGMAMQARIAENLFPQVAAMFRRDFLLDP